MSRKHILRLCGAASKPFLQPQLGYINHRHQQQLLTTTTTTSSSILPQLIINHQRTYSSTTGNVPLSQFPPSNRLTGRTCMITGGTSGIGFAIAERFLQEGASRVILIGRSYERLLHAASRLETCLSKSEPVETPSTDAHQPTTNPGNHHLIHSSERISLLVGDISEAGSWLRELEKAMQTTNPSILINAAGLSISSILPKSEPSDISRILRTNLEGAILTSRAFIRASIRNRVKKRTPSPSASIEPHEPSKCIINISSLLAHKSGTGAVPYAASKAGILGLTRSVAVETAASLRGVVVRSNAIVPGYIETPMISDFTEGETARLRETIPIRRFGRADEVADAAVFLAQNEYANNCVLNLDGGLSAV
ncbi:3-oxoacyl-acyl carrier protein reductase [Aspergillus heteromorphus CBS 117.55]|uniref:3-oxoacyl-acyl carrier protein reductase n=1 Tax=Aspergillus heteromorphus CBS 117.55 TaxID=1448321 RepID=A0A317V2Y4_9EURO|nr:3-oxoacyl-acyl carrier protein reductase [Aspergillus heteromorphus CBS 117.55]PWY68445.1 3-oxoacyl-acyl carrier protein reductase [Aspergillus heteromorphus CBS 117.55]